MENGQLIDHLFRTEYGKLVAILTRYFGPSYIQLAEDTVQDALITALNKWGTDGIPDNPSAWLLQVAKRRAINEVNRTKSIGIHHEFITRMTRSEEELKNVFSKDEIEDNQLRMIFTCCNPIIDTKSQIALTLKTLCGFGIQEVANALLTTKSNINKRLYRAKTTIRKSKLPFQIPTKDQLDTRLQAVSTTLYLMFNEGYNASSGASLIQKDFCLEAMRLTQLLINRFPKEKKLKALQALMCFHISRFEARLDKNGGIIIFEEQDRSKWNKILINKGMNYLNQSKGADQLSVYHIESNIAALHCMAESFEKTDWKNIYKNYEILYTIKPNPIIRLNLAIITSQIKSYAASIQLLNQLESDSSLKNYHLLPVTQGVFLTKIGKEKEAIPYFNKALGLAPSKKERDFILNKLKAY